jgi:pseudouridine-5'-monophosphatase
MDGLLIDTEDLYSVVTNSLLEKYGRPPIPWSIKAQLQGRPGPQATEIFHEWDKLPVPQEQYMSEVSVMQKQIFPSSQPLPGVLKLLQGLKNAGVHLALATSSQTSSYKLKTGHLPHLFEEFFEEKHRVLGDDPRIPKGRGKPAPDIYLLALSLLNESLREKGEKEIQPEECLVFEDSVPGVEAGRRAGMQVVWCPHPGLLTEYKGREKEVLAGLTGEHKEDEEEQLRHTEVQVIEGKRKVGLPGDIDDGWAKLLGTLEEFPYEEFGIKVAN